MNITPNKTLSWQADAQDKKDRLTCSRARQVKESDGTEPSSSGSGKAMTRSSRGKPQGLEIGDSGSSLTSTAKETVRKQNRRGLKSNPWTVAEKEVLLYCYHYSIFEKWSRTSKEILKEKIDKSDLPLEKKETPIPKLRSLISQITRYIEPTKYTTIQKNALRDAEQDYLPIKEEETKRREESRWSRSEKWTLVWAMEYAKSKHSKQKERTEEWRKIFFHFCPGKKNIPPQRITCQRSNILKDKIFNMMELDYLRSEVAKLVASERSPIESPIEMPNCQQSSMPQPELLKHTTQEKLVHNQPGSSVHPRSSPPPISPPQPDPPEECLLPMTQPNPSIESPTPSSTTKVQAPMPLPLSEETTPSSLISPEPDNEQLELEEKIANIIEEVKAMDFEDRPPLSKVQAYGKAKKLIKKVNIALQRLVPDSTSLTELNQITYAAALYINRYIFPEHHQSQIKPKTRKVPLWKRKLQKQLEFSRKHLSQIKQFLSGTKVQGKLKKKVIRLCDKYCCSLKGLDNIAKELEGKILAMARRIEKEDNKYKSRIENKQFKNNPRAFYRNLIGKNISVNEPPSTEDLEEYWRPLFETEKTHNKEAQWIEEVENLNETKPPMKEPIITTADITSKLKKFANYKKPGIDNVPNFWLKQLTTLHRHYSLCFSRILNGEETTPSWLTKGDTSLIPKTDETLRPEKYRPICCLTTTYKLFTGLLADSIHEHLSSGGFLEEEQAGCKRRCLGTKDQLLINKTILEDCRKRKRNLSMAWIDYRKAYDSVPHSWIIQCLELYKIHPVIREIMAAHIQMWQTTISLSHNKGKITIPDVKVKKGIFQGDSLSPLLFCLAIDPLSKLLKKRQEAYNLGKERKQDPANNINHLLFMDDLKLYAGSDNDLGQLLEVVHTFSNDIRMEFGLDKCAKCSLRSGKKVQADNIQIELGTEIRDLEEQEPYKYLGIEENDSIEHEKMRGKIGREYIRRVRKICKTQLTNKNKITAINQLAMPALTYGFGIIDWPQKNINYLDVKTRKMLTLHRVIYRNQCIPRLYLPRREGGLGLLEVNNQHRATLISTGQYLISSEDPNLKIVCKHQETQTNQTTSVTQLAKHFGQDCLTDEMETSKKPATDIARKSRKNYSQNFQDEKKEEWANQQRAKYFLEEISQDFIDKEGSLSWLTNGTLHYDQERIIMAAQDQGLMTNAFKKMSGLSSDSKCRFCQTEVESVNHLISACKVLMGDGYYTARHDGVCKYLHWTICKDLNIPCSDKSWEHVPERTMGNDAYTIHYDYVIPTATYLENAAVKPDIVIWDKKNKVASLIEVSVPNDSGLNRAEREKRTKYQGLMYDMRRNWSLQEISIIPVIIGAKGLMKKNFKKYLSSIPGNPSAEEIQTIALKGTARILKRSLGWNAQ